MTSWLVGRLTLTPEPHGRAVAIVLVARVSVCVGHAALWGVFTDPEGQRPPCDLPTHLLSCSEGQACRRGQEGWDTWRWGVGQGHPAS